MWFLLEKTQHSYTLSERLLRAIQFTSDQSGEDLEDLINQGAAVNQLHGTLLPLHCACMANDVRALKILLDRGAHINSYDGCHRTALHHAVEQSPSCVALLLRYGADTELRDMNLNTPLHWAAFKNNALCVRLLLQNNANVDAIDANHDTPLSWAAMRGNLESVEVLLEYNACVKTRNYNGFSPIQRVALILATGLNTPKDDRCFQLLLRAHGQFNVSKLLRALPGAMLQDSVLGDYTLMYAHTPRSLLCQCRFAIRISLGQCQLPNVVKGLHIPDPLRNYLLLDA
uniref:SOCS box domain-containing protein n=1 Tax=Strigamia maritima TaxID=126957 RepID=T1IPH1_STRMM